MKLNMQCPFCGDTYIYVEENMNGYQIGCNSVGCFACRPYSRVFKSKEDAINAWELRCKSLSDYKKSINGIGDIK